VKYINKEKGYSHLDLKIDNILLDRHLNAKIADFGFARPNKDGIKENIGTRFYRAPEICNNDFPYNGEKADVFALAHVLFTLQYLAYPTNGPRQIKNVTETKEFKMFCQGEYDEFFPATPEAPKQLKDLLIGMFDPNPEQRISLE
jgi:serine/threonine protein kinase